MEQGLIGHVAQASARARPGGAALLARSLGLSRAVRHPGLARRGGPLQADGHRRRLVDRAPFSHHGDLHHRVRPPRPAGERNRGPLSDRGLRRHAAVVPVLHDPDRSLEQSRRQRQPDRQGVFSAHHHPGLIGGRRAGRFRASTLSCWLR